MSSWQKWSLNLLTLANSVSGMAYLWMRYVLEHTDPFSVINHPWQPFMLNLHVLSAPPLLVMFGILVQSHIARKLKTSYLPNRRSGWFALIAFAVMVASGYLLPILTNPLFLRLTLITHLGSSGVFVIGYGAHLAIGLRMARTDAADCSDVIVPTPT